MTDPVAKCGYVKFDDDVEEGRYVCFDGETNLPLGYIVWLDLWDQYSFLSAENTIESEHHYHRIFSSDDLRDIADFMDKMTKERTL